MAVEFEESFGALAPAQVSEFEKRYDLTLPASYRKFLTEVNGGKVKPCGLDVRGWYGRITAVARFYGIHNGKLYNLAAIYEGSEDILPAEFLPIAEDAGGNLITLGIKGPHRNEVYFWDHEDELDDEGESKLDMSNMYKVADDFEQFLEKLYEPR